MTTIFTRIIEGQIPGTFVYRDSLCVAFLSINPLAAVVAIDAISEDVAVNDVIVLFVVDPL